ncbi:hypothetical protein HPB49_003071 [Dermacentor silvarum]|uniref:Uncharacterized protein n=1 Tax=Dermacentor silvarum TaxID=543639 RepID=A0ACB8D2C0_DERSI|nr:hypothetical protein HPB49_003071 [Dermacentor silvarum]
MNNKNAWSNGPPKNVASTTDVSGPTRKESTTQPAHNTMPARPQDIQVREQAELVKSLKQQLASANEHIRQLKNNYNSTTTPPGAEEQMACAQSEVTDMETDRIRGEKRKASSPAPATATEEKREKVKNSTLRIAKLETAINARFKELEAKQAEFQAATEARLTRMEAAIENMLSGINQLKITNIGTLTQQQQQSPLAQSQLLVREEWTSNLIEDANKTTAEAEIEEDHPSPDSRLIHLWEARESIQKR